MKIIKIEVSACKNCLNWCEYDRYPEPDINYCMETDKDIIDIEVIPEWCPLPDAPLNKQINPTQRATEPQQGEGK